MSTTSSQSSTAPDPLIGRTIANRFHVLERIATGGMGLVYKAEQIPLGREVAIKVLESKHIPDVDDTFRQRFLLEAAAAAKLHHPNTIVVYDYGQTDDGTFYIAMEYVPGTTLDRRLKKQGPLTPAQAVHVGLQVCSSLRDAHERGLVHRDVKPGNIMFAPRAGDSYFVKVLDFGLVKVVSDGIDEGLTQNGIVMGSPRYMAPEQVRSQSVDQRTDIYSFGATLYHMLAGAPPFAAGKSFDAMSAHVTQPPPALLDTWPDCPVGPRLDALVMRCLEKKPGARFQTMEDLMHELHACVEEVGGSLSSGSNYLSHLSLPALQNAAEKGDSDPRLSDSPSRKSWSGSDSAPRISGPRPILREPAGADDIDIEVKTVAEAMVDPAAARAETQAKTRLRTLLAIAGLCALAICIGVAAAVLPGEEPAPERPATAAAVAPSEPTEEAPAVESSARPIELRTVPPHATARRAGADLGDTPLTVSLPRGESWEIALVLPGYQPRTVTLRGDQPTVTVHLRPVPVQAAAEPVEPAPEPSGRPGRRVRRPGEAVAPTQGQPTGAAGGDNNADLHDPWTEQE